MTAAGGIVADRLLGEPPATVHPVASFGAAMGHVERWMYAPSRARGAAYTAVGVLLGLTAGRLVPSTLAATWVAVAGRSLGEAALAVHAALDVGDLDGARALLPTLVGRDPSGLDAAEISRAVVESVAENTVDAVVAPALWAALLGGSGAIAHRAVNTMDAMVGHRSDRYERFGWAAARLDDALAWVPARAMALLVAAARPGRAAAVWQAVRHDAPAHPSPNAGVAEAAFAAALGLRLGGENRYDGRLDVRPSLGDGQPAGPGDISAAVALSHRVGLLLAAALLALGARRWRP